MSLQDNLFSEDVEYDVTVFSKDKRRKRVLVFPPVNNYRRFLIHQLVQDRFPDLLHTFSIGQGNARRTVVCYKSDVIRDPKLNGADRKSCSTTGSSDSSCGMGVEGRRSPSASPEHVRVHKQVKSVPSVEIYRPPAARRARNNQGNLVQQQQTQAQQPVTDSSSFTRTTRQRRPDRAVYVPRHRRSLATEGSPQSSDTCRPNRTNQESSSPQINCQVTKTIPNLQSKGQDSSDSGDNENNSKRELNPCNTRHSSANIAECEFNQCVQRDVESRTCNNFESSDRGICNTQGDSQVNEQIDPSNESTIVPSTSQVEEKCREGGEEEEEERVKNESPAEISYADTNESDKLHSTDIQMLENDNDQNLVESNLSLESNNKDNRLRTETVKCNDITSSCTETETVDKKISKQETIDKNKPPLGLNQSADVLIISDKVSSEQRKTKETPVAMVPMAPPEKKVKKVERPKSKPAPPPAPAVKINRDECDWDSLFDDNGDCLDPTLIEELTSSVGEVTIEQPKNDYKSYSKQIEVSSDEFAHVVEIYNFPSDFKTSDLAAVFSPFKNGGFELKWVDDTHCLGVFSSPLVAAEVLASDHPFVKTRPLSEATAMSKTKARRSAEFLQPYRTRPETCAALARRLVTGALGVKLATARQEREHEKNILREAKEKRRLANKQREDIWEGIFPEK